MLCSICNKNLATIHIQEIVNGTKKTIHICQVCAAAKGLNLPGTEVMNLTEFLQNMSYDAPKLSQNFSIDENETKTADILTCQKCGWDSEKIRKTGRLGCPECYHSFRDTFAQSLDAMHRGIVHCGKTPSTVASERNAFMTNLLKLQKKLEKHIKNEEYEEAAKVRDNIKDLKSEKAERE